MLDVSGGMTMRNRVINGCCRVSQRSSVSLTTSNQFGGVDRMLGSYVNGSAGTFVQDGSSYSAGMTFKRGARFQQVTLSSGYITFRHRIEALNTLDMSGQSVTVSAKIFHDYGSTTNFKIGLRKANASDNFSATTAIGTDTTAAVATNTNTVVSGTYTLGSTDADNGLEIVIYHDAASVTTKNVVIGDIQLTLGSEVEQMERRPIGVEDALCKRYYLKNKVEQNTTATYMIGVVASSTAGVRCAMSFPVAMRTAPTAAVSSCRIYDGVSAPNVTSIANQYSSTTIGCIDVTCSAGGLVSGRPALLIEAGGTGYVDFSAEL